MKTYTATAFFGTLAVFLASCSSLVTDTKFKEYHGGGDIHGAGGTKRTVAGVDVWENGTPNRRFRVLGVLEDSTLENTGAAPYTLNVLSVMSANSLATRDKRLAKKAKEHGADAIVFVARSRDFLSMGQYETNFRNQVKVIAVKYVGEEIAACPQLGESRDNLESRLGTGEQAQADWSAIGVPETEASGLKAVRYGWLDYTVLALFYMDAARMIVIASPEKGFNEAEIASLLLSSAQNQQWNATVPSDSRWPLKWTRTDGAVTMCSQTDGIFIVAASWPLLLE